MPEGKLQCNLLEKNPIRTEEKISFIIRRGNKPSALTDGAGHLDWHCWSQSWSVLHCDPGPHTVWASRGNPSSHQHFSCRLFGLNLLHKRSLFFFFLLLHGRRLLHSDARSTPLKRSCPCPLRPLMFIMSTSLHSVLQRQTVCFYKGVRIWVGAWVLPRWHRGRWEPTQMCCSIKMKAAGAFTVSDVCVFQVWGCVDVLLRCIEKERFTFDPQWFVVTLRG